MSEQPQHVVALAQANKVRLARVELKRRINRGEVSVADVVGPNRRIPFEAESMPVAQLLASQRRWGATRTRKYLAALAISERRRVGDLTKRQRGALVDAISRDIREVRNERMLAA